jgi:nitrate reductase alpha subunit
MVTDMRMCRHTFNNALLNCLAIKFRLLTARILCDIVIKCARVYEREDIFMHSTNGNCIFEV